MHNAMQEEFLFHIPVINRLKHSVPRTHFREGFHLTFGRSKVQDSSP